MAAKTTTPRRPAPRRGSAGFFGRLAAKLQAEVTTLKAEIDNHERRGMDQSRTIGTQRTVMRRLQLAVDEARQPKAAAYDERRERHVPLEFWADADLLELLHAIERNARSQTAVASARSARLGYQPVGFPQPLYLEVLIEAADRGLVARTPPRDETATTIPGDEAL